jgi:hypothetical protein
MQNRVKTTLEIYLDYIEFAWKQHAQPKNFLISLHAFMYLADAEKRH